LRDPRQLAIRAYPVTEAANGKSVLSSDSDDGIVGQAHLAALCIEGQPLQEVRRYRPEPLP
jgi:hypothetical protein